MAEGISKEDTVKLPREKDSENTKRVTKISNGVLRLYFQEKGQPNLMRSIIGRCLNKAHS